LIFEDCIQFLSGLLVDFEVLVGLFGLEPSLELLSWHSTFFYIVFSLCLNLCCGISVLLGFLLVFQFLPGLMLVSSTSFNFEFSLGRNISKSYADIICLDNGASSVIAHLFSEGKAIRQSSEERVCSTLLWRASRYEKK